MHWTWSSDVGNCMPSWWETLQELQEICSVDTAYMERTITSGLLGIVKLCSDEAQDPTRRWISGDDGQAGVGVRDCGIVVRAADDRLFRGWRSSPFQGKLLLSPGFLPRYTSGEKSTRSAVGRGSDSCVHPKSVLGSKPQRPESPTLLKRQRIGDRLVRKEEKAEFSSIGHHWIYLLTLITTSLITRQTRQTI